MLNNIKKFTINSKLKLLLLLPVFNQYSMDMLDKEEKYRTIFEETIKDLDEEILKLHEREKEYYKYLTDFQTDIQKTQEEKETEKEVKKYIENFQKSIDDLTTIITKAQKKNTEYLKKYLKEQLQNIQEQNTKSEEEFREYSNYLKMNIEDLEITIKILKEKGKNCLINYLQQKIDSLTEIIKKKEEEKPEKEVKEYIENWNKSIDDLKMIITKAQKENTEYLKKYLKEQLQNIQEQNTKNEEEFREYSNYLKMNIEDLEMTIQIFKKKGKDCLINYLQNKVDNFQQELDNLTKIIKQEEEKNLKHKTFLSREIKNKIYKNYLNYVEKPQKEKEYIKNIDQYIQNIEQYINEIEENIQEINKYIKYIKYIFDLKNTIIQEDAKYIVEDIISITYIKDINNEITEKEKEKQEIQQYIENLKKKKNKVTDHITSLKTIIEEQKQEKRKITEYIIKNCEEKDDIIKYELNIAMLFGIIKLNIKQEKIFCLEVKECMKYLLETINQHKKTKIKIEEYNLTKKDEGLTIFLKKSGEKTGNRIRKNFHRSQEK